MHDSILHMIERYNCQTTQEYKNALKEIIQEVALFGLWRSKFFEHAAFYGGTALRILYGLNRFSEDLDFSLLQKKQSFQLQKYEQAMKTEIESFGFDVSFETKQKNHSTPVQSAFIKANTELHLIKVGIPLRMQKRLHTDEFLKIKLEVDTEPPLGFETESKALVHPLPFSVRSYILSDLFAGKIHALLFRSWKTRVKGRDWYDFIWFMQKGVPINLHHLTKRMEQTGHWKSKKDITHKELLELLQKKIAALDIEMAKKDVGIFLKDSRSIEAWSQEYFTGVLDHLKSL